MADKNVNQTCDCGCEEETEEMITLEFDDGTEVKCSIMGVFEALEREYIALVPYDDSGDVYIYRYKEIDEETFDIEDIDDDDEFNEVVIEFDKIVEENTEGDEQ